MKKLILSLAILLCLQSAAYAETVTTNLIIDVYGGLVQGVPLRSVDRLKKETQIINTNDRAFAVYPDAPAALGTLIRNPNINVLFFVADGERMGKDILKAIKLPDSDESLWNYASKENRFITSEGRLDATKVKLNAGQTFFYTTNPSNLTPGPVNVVTLEKKSYYFYNKYSDAAAAAAEARGDDSKFIPKSETEWNKSFHRWAILTDYLLKGASTGIEAFETDSEAQFAIEFSKSRFQETNYELNSSNGKVTSCIGTQANLTTSTFAEIYNSAEDITPCLSNGAKIEYYWDSFEQNACAAFVGSLYLKDADKSNCTSVTDAAVYDNRLKSYKISKFPVIFDISYLNPAPKVIGGVQLPRWNAPLFRGIRAGSPQLDYPKTIRALLGDPTALMETKKLSEAMSATSALSGTPVFNALSYLRDTFSGRSRADIDAEYIDKNSGRYNNWPTDVMFATFFPGVAVHYSKEMVWALHDYRSRGVDLNFAMNSVGEGGSTQDTGEYILPITIYPDEMDGVMMNGKEQQLFNVTESGEKYLLVYYRHPCLFKGSDSRIYNCKIKDETQYKMYDPPMKEDDEATAFAVVALCPEEGECKLPTGFFARHQVKPSAEGIKIHPALDPETLIEGKPLKLRGKIAKVFYSE